MTAINYRALPTETVRALQAGGSDANGSAPVVQVSDGGGNPCRHCLELIAEGEAMLILNFRPFPGPQPYAEQGPIFLHAKPCTRHPDSDTAPAIEALPFFT